MAASTNHLGGDEMTDYLRSLIKRAKLPRYWHDTDAGKDTLSALVAMVREDERERCARICEAWGMKDLAYRIRASHGHRDTSCDGQPQ
jgi:hypothetical protein